jgi:hypothetical protein
MIWIPSDEEIKSVLALGGAKRYGYCVEKAADQQQLWSLRQDDGWALASDDAGRELVPVWPHEEFALVCVNGIWKSYQAKAINLDSWLDRWIPGMEKDSRLVVVFPTPRDKGVAVEPSRFAADLREASSQYD